MIHATPRFGCRGTTTAQEKTAPHPGANRDGVRLNLRAFSGPSTRIAKRVVEVPSKDATNDIGPALLILQRSRRT